MICDAIFIGQMPGPIASTDTKQDKRPIAVSCGDFIPKPPKWLNADAKKIFKEAATRIVMLNIGGEADSTTLAIYAYQYARLQELSAASSKGDLKQERLRNDLVASVLSLANQLGLSPGGRARLRIVKDAGKEASKQMAQAEAMLDAD